MQWEYKLVTSIDDIKFVKAAVRELNELGKEDWELVTVIWLPESANLNSSFGAYRYFLKREVEDDD